MEKIIVWIISAVLLLVSLVLLSGHGAFLIAGYNTASMMEKKRYDEKKLCRVMGMGLLVIAICVFVTGYFDGLQFIALSVVLISIVTMLILSNTICKRKDVVISDEELVSTKSNKAVMMISAFVGLITIIVVGFLLFGSTTNVDIQKDSIHFRATLTSSKTIAFSEIEDLRLETSFSKGKRVSGLGTFDVSAGNFKNDTLGNYILYSHNDCKSYIIIKLKDDHYVVFNEANDEQTLKSYQKIKQAL